MEVTTMSKADQPTESEQKRALPLTLQGPFFEKVAERKAQNRDAKIIITARDGQTGVGKTSLAVCLAKALDTSGTPFDAEEQATLSVPTFMAAYDELPLGSSLILDEAEQLDSRRSMRNENIDAAFRWQTRRVNQIVAILTLPSADMLDKRMEQLADYWIDVKERGECVIYEKKIHPIKKSIYYKTLQRFKWPNMDWDPAYKELARMKEEFNNDKESDDNWVRKSEVDDRVKKAVKKAEREARDNIIQNLSELPFNYKDLAPAFDLSPQRFGQIARGE